MEKVLVIVGPTGVGKTALSVNLAAELHGEIISGDSMQVYQEMTIGTAKVTQEEAKGIPHYLIDRYSFTEEYHVKMFQELARTYIQDINGRHKLPIICGGTGLYIKSTIYDYQFTEQETDEDFMCFLQTLGNDQLWSILTLVDPNACATIHPNNRQRMVRAIYMAHTGDKKSEIVEAQVHEPIYDAFMIGLTMDRVKLYERINARVDQMMIDGLFEEIQQLVKAQPECWNLQSFQGIGYKEWKNYFAGEATKEECVELIKKNSRNFAKRQYTWFHNQMDVHWYDIMEEGYPMNVMQDIKDWLQR